MQIYDKLNISQVKSSEGVAYLSCSLTVGTINSTLLMINDGSNIVCVSSYSKVENI